MRFSVDIEQRDQILDLDHASTIVLLDQDQRAL